MVIYDIVCKVLMSIKAFDSRTSSVPSAMYVGCLNWAICTNANRYLVILLSGTPIRACKRFFVSENFSSYQTIKSHLIGRRQCRQVLTYWSDNEAEWDTMRSECLLCKVENVDNLVRLARIKLVNGNFLRLEQMISEAFGKIEDV